MVDRIFASILPATELQIAVCEIESARELTCFSWEPDC